jgi:hypothetical protein
MEDNRLKILGDLEGAGNWRCPESFPYVQNRTGLHTTVSADWLPLL